MGKHSEKEKAKEKPKADPVRVSPAKSVVKKCFCNNGEIAGVFHNQCGGTGYATTWTK